jgi:hypothetical protein
MTTPKIAYLKNESPFQNINRLFGIFKLLDYNIEITNIQGKRICRLLSHWGDATDLRERLVDFESNFCEALVDFSLSMDMSDYHPYLRKLETELIAVNAHFSYPNHRFKIKILRETDLDELRNQFKDMETHFFTIATKNQGDVRIFFNNLREGVNRERQELQKRSYIYTESNYEWVIDKESGIDKNDLSELAAAIYASKAVKRRDNGKLMPNTFAADFAAFFGIEKLNFRQSINLINSRSRRERGEFIDKCKSELLRYLDKQLK